MSDDEIDLDRVVADADYRRQVIEFLNENDNCHGADGPGERKSNSVQPPGAADTSLRA